MKPILLDTHAAIWAAGHSLKTDARRVVDDAAGRGELLISPISAWEIGMLTRRGKISLTFALEEYVRVLFSQPGVVVAALTPFVALAAATLAEKAIRDPADRILIATATAYGAQLMTRDKKIHAYAKATGALRCLPC
ncbi:MAG: type II toxin-antitoxin system VapC family toxin [Candidatus Eremiobacteraeota bacterium]|nr:type II toxin-antitoxin system VapC family toxin [Candidatus Eremiobacteraeota bacterium]